MNILDLFKYVSSFPNSRFNAHNKILLVINEH